MKFVEVEGRPQLAKEVSWRSNTQNAVNARNLVALGGPQAPIARDFEERYPGVLYQTRPDASLDANETRKVIANDHADQSLCAFYSAMPWLAVKRLVLFDSENHALIFNEDITASGDSGPGTWLTADVHLRAVATFFAVDRSPPHP